MSGRAPWEEEAVYLPCFRGPDAVPKVRGQEADEREEGDAYGSQGEREGPVGRGVGGHVRHAEDGSHKG